MTRHSDTLTQPTLSLELPGHGTFSVSAARLDDAVSRYLPSSPRQLRAIVEERTQLDYSDVRDASALLIVLADLDGGQL